MSTEIWCFLYKAASAYWCLRSSKLCCPFSQKSSAAFLISIASRSLEDLEWLGGLSSIKKSVNILEKIHYLSHHVLIEGRDGREENLSQGSNSAFLLRFHVKHKLDICLAHCGHFTLLDRYTTTTALSLSLLRGRGGEGIMLERKKKGSQVETKII